MPLLEPCFQLRHSWAELYHFAAGFRRRARAEEARNQMQRRRGGGAHLFKARLKRVLNLVVGIEGRLQIPDDELLPPSVGSHDQLAQ